MSNKVKAIIMGFMILTVTISTFANEELPLYLDIPSPPIAVDDRVSNPDTLIFSGGGASGVAYAGVLKYLEEQKKAKGNFKNVKRYVGASAGAIFSLIFYLDIPFIKTEEIIDGINWPSLIKCENGIPLLKIIKNPKSFTTLINAVTIFNTENALYGLSKGQNIENELEKIIIKSEYSKTGRITFADLKKKILEKTGKEKDLVVVAYSTAYGKTCFLSADTTPDMDVITAVRASMAIPFIYTPVHYNGIGGKDDYLVDGGTTYNYPIEYFDKIGAKSLGFVLCSANDYYYPEYHKINSLLDLFKRVGNGLLNNVTPRMVNNVYRTVFIDTPSVGTLSFDMTPKERKEAVDQGYEAARCYFENLKMPYDRR